MGTRGALWGLGIVGHVGIVGMGHGDMVGTGMCGAQGHWGQCGHMGMAWAGGCGTQGLDTGDILGMGHVGTVGTVTWASWGWDTETREEWGHMGHVGIAWTGTRGTHGHPRDGTHESCGARSTPGLAPSATSSATAVPVPAGNLCGEAGAAQRALEDAFLRRFLYGTFPGLLADEVVLKRRGNLLVIGALLAQALPPPKLYFLLGYAETLLGHFYKCPVRLELQTVPTRVPYKYL